MISMVAVSSMAAERYHVVTVNGFDRQPDHRLMTDDELKQMKSSISAESLFFSRAVSAAKKDWATDESKKGQRFPMLAKRTLRVARSFQEQDDAMKALQSLMPKEKAEDKKKSKKNKEEPGDSREAIMNEAVQMLAGKLSEVSGGKVTGATLGETAAVQVTAKAKSGKTTAGQRLEDFELVMFATVFYLPEKNRYSLIPVPGTRVNGKALFSPSISEEHVKQFGVTEEWVDKKVRLVATTMLIDKGNEYSVRQPKAIKVLELVD